MPSSLAISAFDGVYGNGPYEKNWKSIRLALLSPQKYAAVVNNYSGNRDAMDSFFRELGALPLSDYLQAMPEIAVEEEKEMPKTQTEVNSTESSSMDETLHDRLRDLSKTVRVAPRVEKIVKPMVKKTEEVEEADTEEPSEFMPASRVVDEDIHARPDSQPRQPKRSERVSLIPDLSTVELPQFLQAYVFPRGDISRFPAPSYDKTGFCGNLYANQSIQSI